MKVARLVAGVIGATLLSAAWPGGLQAQTLAVANAGSLAQPFKELIDSFSTRNPGVRVTQENGGSLELARRLRDLGRVPDVFATADVEVISRMLMPDHATWYAPLARNAMVLAYTPSSLGAGEINGDNWWQVVTRPGVRMGASDPAVDPNGYRTLLVFQLAERFYRQAGLEGRLQAAVPPKQLRPNETDLLALLEAGELDYAWSYRSLAVASGLHYVELPAEIDLSDSHYAAQYATAAVRVRGKAPGDSLVLHGAPILYGVTVPSHASHPELGAKFVSFLFSPVGRAILARDGFIPLDSLVRIGTQRSGPRFR